MNNITLYIDIDIYFNILFIVAVHNRFTCQHNTKKKKLYGVLCWYIRKCIIKTFEKVRG